MNIKILGMGCPSCHKLESNTREALKELRLEAEIESVTDVTQILSYNVMTMPVLVVDEQVCVTGKVPSVDELKTILKDIR